MKSWYSGMDLLQKKKDCQTWEPSKGLEEFTESLHLLEMVPMEYLVGDELLLPMESLRFFFIDENWVECLVDGALSIGRNSSFDNDRQVREKLLKDIREKVSGQNGCEVRTGFLLRSRLVSGWPGMNIRCYGGEEKRPLNCLRISRIGEDILLFLVDGIITCVEFVEPTEGLALGFEVNEEGKMVVPVGTLPFLPVPFRENGLEGVIDVDALANSLEESLKMSEGSVTALEFSAKLLQTPLKYCIQGGLYER